MMSREVVATLGLSSVLLGVRRVLRRFVRYEVAGGSMLPTLRAGDWLVADRRVYADNSPRPGHIVISRDPRDASRTIIKRVASVGDDGRAFLEGDNPAESADSRTFGPVSAAAILGRVRLRYWPNPRLF